MSKPFRMLMIGDIHMGSWFSPIMPGMRMVQETGNEFILDISASLQEKLWTWWNRMIENVGKVDLTVVNGDAIDGMQYRDRGKYVWTTDWREQAKWCAELLSTIKSKRFYFTSGSGYHVGSNPQAEATVADIMRGMGYQTFHATDFFLKKHGRRIHFCHHINVSKSNWQTRTSMLARELTLALLNEKHFGEFDGVVRSHAHYHIKTEFANKFAMILPAWQARTPFVAKNSLGWVSDIGYVVCTITPNREFEFEREVWAIKEPIKEVDLDGKK